VKPRKKNSTQTKAKPAGFWLLPILLCEENTWQCAKNVSREQQPLQLQLLLKTKPKKQNKTKQKASPPSQKAAHS
jgi:hypothetical protein